MEVSTKQSKQTARNSIPKTRQNVKPERVKKVSAPRQTTNAWTEPFVPSIVEFPLAMSANRRKRPISGPSTNQEHQPVSKIQAKPQQNGEEQMDDVLETIQMTLTGAASLIKKISTGNTRLVSALNKIMEAAMDAINTLTV